MNWKLTLVAAVCLPLVAPAGGAEKHAATKPAATAPAGIVATVGTDPITRKQVEVPLRGAPPNLPPEQLEQARQKVLGGLIATRLMHAYVVAQKVACDPNALAGLKAKLATAATERKMTPQQLMDRAGLTEEVLKDQIRLQTLIQNVASKDKANAFIQAHPDCFNGTKVQASHILIACKPTAATSEQKAAVAKLQAIAGQIAGGKTTFEAAAMKHSACQGSKNKGGDLGEFDFASMVPPFSMKAFSMKVGETSGVVRTQFGFHLIKTTKRTPGTSPAGADASKVAQRILMAGLQNRIFDQALTTCPIVIHK